MSIFTNPINYHGNSKKINFFEGWYFKLTTKNNDRSLAFIPGIYLGNNKDSTHCFIQILDGNDKTSHYIKYDSDSFRHFNNPFKINIEKNSFSLQGLSLDIKRHPISVKANVTFKNLYVWKDSFLNPGSMGFYNYIPFMECYSHVAALDGKLYGTIFINKEEIDFTDGKIYIEKNWGKNFPSEWIWIQCNSFNNNNASLTCSIGKVPFLRSSFQGFLIGVYINNKFYKFTTINRSTINLSFNNNLLITAKNRNFILTFEVYANKKDFILCYGPKNGLMTPYVKENIIANVNLKLKNVKTSKIIYEGYGVNTGVEFGGNFINKLY